MEPILIDFIMFGLGAAALLYILMHHISYTRKQDDKKRNR